MRILFIIITLFVWLNAGSYKLNYWQADETFGGYLTRHGIDATKFYAQIDPDDVKYLSEVQSNTPFFENIQNGTLKEALIPLSDEMQIYIAKKGNDYTFDIVPIEYKTVKDSAIITIESNCFADIKKATNNAHLATYIKRVFKDKVDFTKLKKGDKVAVKYTQKSIKGLPWGKPIINAAYVHSGKNEYFALKSGDDYRVWTNFKSRGRVVKKVTVVTRSKAKYISFTKPLKKIRVTSTFSYRRWHPILHRYRPHHGTDFGAKLGTPIHALASGKVIFAGWMRGYGRVTKIDHGSGYVTLYAHQSKQLVRVGQHVKAWQVIGKIGSTGRSTGPHLHLGLYKNGKPVDPQKYINRIVRVKGGIKSTKVVKVVTNMQKGLPNRVKRVYNSLLKIHGHNFIWKSIDKKVNIVIKKRKVDKHAARVQLSDRKGDA